MPIYEYVCPECKVKFDRLQPSGTSHAECPDCGLPSRKALSLFSAFVSTDGDFAEPVAGMGGCGGCAGGACACSAAH